MNDKPQEGAELAAGSQEAAKPKARGRGKPWQKGQSGNPSGAKPDAERRKVHELARPYTQEAIDTLREIMLSGATERARVAAAEVLLDRGWGKAPASLTLSSDSDNPLRIQVESMSDDAIRARALELVARDKSSKER